MDELRDATLDAFGTAHVVCNNAGVSGRRHAMAETTDADWDWVVGVNLMGVVHGVRSFASLLIEQGEGHVVNTASLAGLSAVPFAAPYVATKHAVVGLSQSLVARVPGERIGRRRDRAVSRLAQHRHRRVPQQLANRAARAAALPIPTTPRVQFIDAVFVDAVATAPGPEAYARKVVAAVRDESVPRAHRDAAGGAGAGDACRGASGSSSVDPDAERTAVSIRQAESAGSAPEFVDDVLRLVGHRTRSCRCAAHPSCRRPGPRPCRCRP